MIPNIALIDQDEDANITPDSTDWYEEELEGNGDEIDVNCFACGGSGEGRASGFSCSYCNGSGVIKK